MAVDTIQSIAEASAEFIAWARLTKAEATGRAYEAALRRFCAFAQVRGLIEPSDVHVRDVDDWLLSLRSEGLAPITVNHRLATLRSFWRWMRRRELCENNPASDADRLRQPQPLPSYLSADEQRRLLAWLRDRPGDAGRRDEALFCISLYAGLRCNELVNLKLADLDLPGGTLHVRDGKGGKDRELPIVPQLAEAIERYLPARLRLLAGVRPGIRQYRGRAFARINKRDHYLGPAGSDESRQRYDALMDVLRGDPRPCPWLLVAVHGTDAAQPAKASVNARGEKLGRHSVNYIVRRRGQQAIGRHVHPHELRHSFATRLREAGGGIELIGEALGHADIGTTMMYAHLAGDQRRAKIAGLLAGV
jgi:site-specific recombinase XerD